MCVILTVAAVAAVVAVVQGASGKTAARSSPAHGPTSQPDAASRHWPGPGTNRIVALGDSVAAGTACNCTPFVDLVARQLTTGLGQTVSSANLAVGGETSSQLVQLLSTDTTRQQLRGASLVLVMIGANDLEDLRTGSGCASLNPACYSAALSPLRGQISDAVRQIKSTTERRAVIVLLGYWNVFLDGDVARSYGPSYLANSKTLTGQVNADIGAAARQEGALYVDTSALFQQADGDDDTKLLADDGDHPNATGQQVIADGVLRVLRAAGCPC